MKVLPIEIPFAPVWPDPDPRFTKSELAPAPALPLEEVLGPRLARWVREAADAKGAPTDYVLAGLLAVAGAAIGNARWASPWAGWSEPPILWAMCIGAPSAGKSPAIDAALAPLRRAERLAKQKAESARKDWQAREEIAKLAESSWRESVRAAMKSNEAPPAKPPLAIIEAAPHVPRYVVNDATIEAIAMILSRQPKGVLQMRDELSGWLENMSRYSGGGSDRPFWLEAFGGRSYPVNRVGREAVTIERVSIGVIGGIQPDRLKSLLFRADDDGLLARFLPIWPDPAPLRRPHVVADDGLVDQAVARLMSLDLVVDEAGEVRPWLVPFAEDARGLMDDWRTAVRGWEHGAEGLMLSFLGKLPGLAARLALVLACLDWAAEGADMPQEIGVGAFGRAAHLVEAYLLPMARRAYADAATPKADRAARRLVVLICEQGWSRFTSRDVLRLQRAGLETAERLNPALSALEDGDVIRAAEPVTNPVGGRPHRAYDVNPALTGGAG